MTEDFYEWIWSSAQPSFFDNEKKIFTTLLKIVGPPLTGFDPEKYVDSWLLRKRQAGWDTKSN